MYGLADQRSSYFSYKIDWLFVEVGIIQPVKEVCLVKGCIADLRFLPGTDLALPDRPWGHTASFPASLSHFSSSDEVNRTTDTISCLGVYPHNPYAFNDVVVMNGNNAGTFYLVVLLAFTFIMIILCAILKYRVL
jgi:hypothetical protein